MTKPQTVTHRLLDVLDAKEPDGSPTFSNDELEAFLPPLILALHVEVDGELPVAMQEMVGRFAEKIGFDEQTPAEQLTPLMNAYYDQHPLSSDLERRFGLLLRDLIAAEADPPRDERALANVTGSLKGNRPVPKGDGLPGVGAGPLARFIVGDQELGPRLGTLWADDG